MFERIARRHVRSTLVIVILLARAAAADPVAAEPKPAPTDQPAPRIDAPTTPTEPSALDERAAHDAAADRALGFGTAINLRPGSVDITLRSVLNHGGMLSAAIGVTRSVELSVQAIRIGTVGMGFGAGAKVALHRARTWALAVDGNITVGDNRYATASALISTCIDDCVALFTSSVGVASVDEHGVRLFDNPDAMSGPQLVGDASIVIGTSWLRPLIEVADFGMPLGFAGARFTSRHLAFDIGVGAAYHYDTQAGAVIALTVRP
jgi:hypothetical protein